MHPFAGILVHIIISLLSLLLVTDESKVKILDFKMVCIKFVLIGNELQMAYFKSKCL